MAYVAAMYAMSSATTVPLLRDLLKTARNSEQIDLALGCLGDKSIEAMPALAEITKLLDVGSEAQAPTSTQRLAACALGRMGAGAKAALPALTQLAERYAQSEIGAVTTGKPPSMQDYRGDPLYSFDPFVNAIGRIRQK